MPSRLSIAVAISRGHLQSDGPEKEAVDHSNSDTSPSLVPGWYITSLGTKTFQVVGEEVSVRPAPVFDDSRSDRLSRLPHVGRRGPPWDGFARRLHPCAVMP